MRPTLGPTFSLLLAKLREIGRDNNLLEDTTTGVGGKNSLACVASYPALTFFLQNFLLNAKYLVSWS